ncbi:hypothetical protein [Curtobacterium sp. TXMA1]|uniref:hypothetical protein n=1 Tax=Curtobacterium sp. TXMA1 TaxID=2876939 RepID=UPI001CCC2F52|nr:hypothetical protein [Curtobacterium sp. TXMA1]UBQ02147.1 hypothetical protein LCG91_13980 [Curtobacterium sp. TXMA1]
MPRKTIALATAVLTAALLAGCASGGAAPASGRSGSGSGGTGTSSSSTPTAAAQTRAEACTTLRAKVEDSAKGLQSLSDMQSDPQAAVARLEEFDRSLTEGIDAVQNADVKPKAEAFQTAYRNMVAKIQGMAKDPQSVDVSGFSTSAEQVQQAAKDIDTVCAD